MSYVLEVSVTDSTLHDIKLQKENQDWGQKRFICNFYFHEMWTMTIS